MYIPSECFNTFQLNELKFGLAERNQLLSDMQRHLLNHEVANRLLEASVERKDLELQYYKDKDRSGIIRRWSSFTGKDLIHRPVCITVGQRNYFTMFFHTSRQSHIII